MITAYGLISRELYRGIQFELSQNRETPGEIHHKSNQNSKRLFVHIDLAHMGHENINFTFYSEGEAAVNYNTETENTRIYQKSSKYL